MDTLTLDQITEAKPWIGLGIAGNQPGHLGQAGEADDFKDIIALESAPKGLFPWYIPGNQDFLGINPLSSRKLNLNRQTHLQPEPEVCLVVKFDYTEQGQHATEVIKGLSVIGYSVFNDCSRRVNEPKLSLKKNWGADSQGMAEEILPIDDFLSTDSSIMSYRIGCFLRRDGEMITYSKDTAVSEYCYFNTTLTEWIINQINTQKDQGPLEYLAGVFQQNKPELGLIAIGATSYSDFGNSDQKFLKDGDEVTVVLYDSHLYAAAEIQKICQQADVSQKNLLILRQSVYQS